MGLFICPHCLAQHGARGDGPLVKCCCLIFLAQTPLVPTPCNDTGVNRAPGTIITGVERQESPGGAAAAGVSPASSVPREEPLQSDSCLETCGVQASHGCICLNVAPWGLCPQGSPLLPPTPPAGFSWWGRYSDLIRIERGRLAPGGSGRDRHPVWSCWLAQAAKLGGGSAPMGTQEARGRV